MSPSDDKKGRKVPVAKTKAKATKPAAKESADDTAKPSKAVKAVKPAKATGKPKADAGSSDAKATTKADVKTAPLRRWAKA